MGELFSQFDKEATGLIGKEEFFEAADSATFREMIAPSPKKSREAEKVELRILKKDQSGHSKEKSWLAESKKHPLDLEKFETAPDPKDIDQWAPGDVVDWIRYGRWTQELDADVKQEDAEKVAVDGRNFVQLDDNDLVTMGIKSFSTRLKIKNAIAAAVNAEGAREALGEVEPAPSFCLIC